MTDDPSAQVWLAAFGFQVVAADAPRFLRLKGTRLRGSERVAPPQAREAREIPLGREEFAPVLGGQGREVGVGVPSLVPNTRGDAILAKLCRPPSVMPTNRIRP